MLDKMIFCQSGVNLMGQTAKFCSSCHVPLKRGELPLLALANGLHVGDLPKELQDLTFVERLLNIARARSSILKINFHQN